MRRSFRTRNDRHTAMAIVVSILATGALRDLFKGKILRMAPHPAPLTFFSMISNARVLVMASKQYIAA